PILGVNGAIISVIITEIIIAILFERTVNKDFDIKINKLLYFLMITSLLIMYIDINLVVELIGIVIIFLLASKMISDRVRILWKR
ncbi:hypothetical protein, partial [Staphylococcus equorum]|uniref:hypothetical protein n=1 Tax=Staphylococcus equorum TaxID=246432 RepID=UPI001C70FB0A